jgi:hypothetical protein
MGKSTLLFRWATVAAIAALCAGAASATRNGTSVLHYMTRTSLTNTGVEPDVLASLRLQRNEQGRAAMQKFDLSATGLQPRTEYFIIVARGETNAHPVGTVTSDNSGRIRLSYMKKGNGNGNGKGKKALPAELDPVTDILGIGLQETGATQTVAFAWINGSEQYQYLVKRNLTRADSNATPAGSISLKANKQNINFRLLADGLSAGGVYFLALNSNVVDSATANADGAVNINGWAGSAPAVLDVRSLSLLDGNTNVVLWTLLPK